MATPPHTAIGSGSRLFKGAVSVIGIVCALAGFAVVIAVLATRGYSMAAGPYGYNHPIGKNAFFMSSALLLLHIGSFMLRLVLDLIRTKHALPTQSIAMPVIWAILSCIPGLHIIGGWMVFARNAANTAPSSRVERRWRILRWTWLVCAIAASLWLVVTAVNPISAFSASGPWAIAGLCLPSAISCASLLIWKFSTHFIVGSRKQRASDVFM